MSASLLSVLAQPSRLMLSDRLLHLAEDADRAGCPVAAEHLLALAHSVFDEATPREAATWSMPISRCRHRAG